MIDLTASESLLKVRREELDLTLITGVREWFDFV